VRVCGLTITFVLLLVAGISHAAEQRLALVIGNDAYAIEPLKRAVGDARAIRDELQKVGFEVTYRENADRLGMLRALDEFARRLGPDTVALFYYAGHGVQIDGANYLAPVDLRPRDEIEVQANSVQLVRALETITSRKPRFTLAIIDACRDNPFKTGNTRSLGGTRGLAVQPATGAMVIYSASANQTALDWLDASDHDPNGLFTRELLKQMRQPELSIGEIVVKVKQTVIEKARAVHHEQVPAVYDESVGAFYFIPRNEAIQTASTGSCPAEWCRSCG
jgi:uncharacterized caspase-like protein